MNAARRQMITQLTNRAGFIAIAAAAVTAAAILVMSFFVMRFAQTKYERNVEIWESCWHTGAPPPSSTQGTLPKPNFCEGFKRPEYPGDAPRLYLNTLAEALFDLPIGLGIAVAAVLGGVLRWISRFVAAGD